MCKFASIQMTTNADEQTREKIRDALQSFGFKTDVQFPNGEVAVSE